jgi:hypothetical protein
LLLLVVASAFGLFGRPHIEPLQAADKPEASLATDLDAAQKLLEQKKYAEFMERFAPAEELRRIRRADAMDQAAKAFTQRPEAAKKVQDILKSLKDRKPRFDSSGSLAVFEFDSTPPAEPKPAQPSVVVPTPAKKAPPPRGFGNDLTKAIAAAQQAVQADKMEEFIDKFLSASESSRLQDPDSRQTFLLRLKQLPQVKNQILADLKTIASLKPEMSEEGKVASWVLKGKDVPDRTIRLRVFDGDWRLFDGNERIVEWDRKIEQSKPVDAPARSQTRVEFERLGNGWRFVEWKLQ